jgi:hypothetical protein
MRPTFTTVTILLSAAATVLTGCGYSTAPMHRTDVKTVYVPIWNEGKEVYRRGLEFRLTEAVIKRLRQVTDYKLADKAHADTMLTGTIELVPQRVLSANPDTGLPRELEATFLVSFTWTDMRTGKPIVKRSNIREVGTYIPPFSESFYQGSEDVINRLAERIVQEMEADW